MKHDNKPFNPLALDPEDFDKLPDDEFVRLEDLEESDSEYEIISYGGRRRKPYNNPY